MHFTSTQYVSDIKMQIQACVCLLYETIFEFTFLMLQSVEISHVVLILYGTIFAPIDTSLGI